jgi:magnesium-transporting ATPase (P-type)
VAGVGRRPNQEPVVNGLTRLEAASRLKEFGENKLKPSSNKAIALQFLLQFKNPLVLVLLVLTSLGVVITAMVLPFTPLAPYLGFSALPASFFGLLAILLVTYLLMVEGGKQWFYRRLMKV